MYLAPLNYDRYFKKVFSDTKIAKRFIEDFLDVKIQEIEILPIKKAITDDARYVEFDFRCKIDDRYVIIDMQQWYKPDVVHRFYLYHSLNSALQLEDLRKKIILLPDNKYKEVKDYSTLQPVITIVWLVHDNLTEKADYSGFTVVTENVLDFLRNAKLWENQDLDELRKFREELLAQINNNTKNLRWLQENRLIYAYQKNIVKNQKFTKYKPWFELAEKTLKKISDKFAYKEYEKDAIFSKVIKRLKTVIKDPDEIKYIENYDEYIEKVQRYDDGMKREGYIEAENQFKPLIESKDKELQSKDKELHSKDKELQSKDKELHSKDKELQSKDKELEKAKKQLLESVKQMKSVGIPVETIQKATGLSREEIERI